MQRQLKTPGPVLAIMWTHTEAFIFALAIYSQQIHSGSRVYINMQTNLTEINSFLKTL